jgi:hypothetical protein
VCLSTPLKLRDFFSQIALSTCDQMATIILSFLEGIDRKNNTDAKFRFLFAGLGARQVTFQLMGGWGVAAD